MKKSFYSFDIYEIKMRYKIIKLILQEPAVLQLRHLK